MREHIAAISRGAAGVAGGGVLASTVAAGAADTGTGSAATADSGSATSRPAGDPAQSRREAHLSTADGQRLTVQMDEGAVTGTAGPGQHGPRAYRAVRCAGPRRLTPDRSRTGAPA